MQKPRPAPVTGAMWPYPMVVRMVVVKNTDWMKSQLMVKFWSNQSYVL